MRECSTLYTIIEPERESRALLEIVILLESGDSDNVFKIKTLFMLYNRNDHSARVEHIVYYNQARMRE
jgi:hypothetical protein